MSFELFIARRYLKAERKGFFAVVTTIIGVAGVTIGVAALIATLSVMNGFQTDIEKKIIGAQSHLTVLGDLGPLGLQRVESVLAHQPDVVADAPFALGQAILTAHGRSIGIAFKGIEPAREFQVNQLGSALTSGDWSALTKPVQGTGNQRVLPIVLGEELAKDLGVWTTDTVVLISPEGMDTPLGVIPRMRKFRVVGTVRTGYYEFDATFAYMSLPAAAEFLGTKDPVTGVGVRLKNMDEADAVARSLQKELGFDYTVRTFAELNGTLFSALKLEKAVMFLILALIVLVATFNIASNLLLLSTEKARDIGILRALGMTRRGAWKVFWWVGLLIGLIGVACGTALGLLVSWIIGRFPIVTLPADIYYVTRVPVDVHATDVAWVAGTALCLCILSTLYPAWRAAQVDPVEAIHYG